MKMHSLSLLMIMPILFAQFVNAEEFELLNKLDIPIEFAIGSGAEPLARKYQANQLELTKIQPGSKSKTLVVDNKKTPQLLIRQVNKPDIAFIYEFQTKPGKKIFVRILDTDRGPVVEPQTYVYNSLTKDDIILLKTIGTESNTCPLSRSESVTGLTGLKNEKPSSIQTKEALEILGFSANAKPSKTEITKAYRALSLKCHPDKKTGSNEQFQKLDAAYKALTK